MEGTEKALRKDTSLRLIDIQSLFEGANEYAYLGNRTDPHAGDALAAQDEVFASKRLRRESTKRRKGES